MNRSTGCVPLATLMLCAAAQAADEPGFYFAAAASRVAYDGQGHLFSKPYSRNRQTMIDDVDTGFSATVGYRINRYIAGELTYADFGEYERIDRYDLGSIGRSEDRTLFGVRGPSLSVLGSLPLGEQWEVFLRGGVLFADQKITHTFGGNSSDEVGIAGAGVQWSFAPSWAARLEYQLTRDMNLDALARSESSIDQTSLSVLFKL
jgi:opacity protein-like surface antigen